METAVIILTYGREALTRLTLKSLIHSNIDRSKVSVTVVDNGSAGEMMPMLMSFRKHIDHLVLLNENKGKPYGWNLGASIARENCIATGLTKPEYYLFCDNDIDFKKDWYDKLLTTYKEHEDKENLCFLGAMRWPGHKVTDESLKTGDTTQINIVRFPPGCCVLISAGKYNANGSWDTKRLIRTVDTAYYRNVLRRGYFNATMYPASVIVHTGRKQRSWRIDNGEPKYIK